jgi:MFS superfamily sulfate permease-like transporter
MADASSTPFASTGRPKKTPGVGSDLRAGIVVYLVALPLCLGIASACGAPPIAGLIAGIIGGLVVGSLSESHVSVAGPAAGLTVIVIDGIADVGWHTFIAATVVAGAVQVGLGVLRLGRVGQIVPSAVIRGMMAAIGLILVLKQLPHALGYDRDPEGDFAFWQPDGHNTLSELVYSLLEFTPGAVVVSAVCVVTLWAWRDWPKLPLRRWLPRELVVVLVGLVWSAWSRASRSSPPHSASPRSTA